MKPITPRLHGVADYSACAAMFALPLLLGLTPRARNVSISFAGSYLLVSALTAYPLGFRKLIPFPTHGRIELASAPMLLALPALLGGLGGRRERLYFLGLLGTVLSVYTLTDWQADPDV